jgi:hypothetical protein
VTVAARLAAHNQCLKLHSRKAKPLKHIQFVGLPIWIYFTHKPLKYQQFSKLTPPAFLSKISPKYPVPERLWPMRRASGKAFHFGAGRYAVNYPPVSSPKPLKYQQFDKLTPPWHFGP